MKSFRNPQYLDRYEDVVFDLEQTLDTNISKSSSLKTHFLKIKKSFPSLLIQKPQKAYLYTKQLRIVSKSSKLIFLSSIYDLYNYKKFELHKKKVYVFHQIPHNPHIFHYFINI